MKKILVPTDPRHAMDSITVGAGSFFECILVGVDPRIERISVAFGISHDTYANPVDAVPVPGGEWKVNAPGAFFPAADSSHYHVTGWRGEASQYLGGGSLFVQAGVPQPPSANA